MPRLSDTKGNREGRAEKIEHDTGIDLPGHGRTWPGVTAGNG